MKIPSFVRRLRSRWKELGRRMQSPSVVSNGTKVRVDGTEVLGVTGPRFCTTANERAYITAIGCEIGFGGTRGLQPEGGRRVLYSTHLALQNSTSIVSLMLTTEVFIADIKEVE